MYRVRLIIIFFISSSVYAQPSEQVDHTFFLIGDCGEPYVKDERIAKVFPEHVRAAGDHTTVLFLGDNVYVKGLPERGHRIRERGEDILKMQAGWLQGSTARGIFVPGNHDWDHWGKNGYQYVLNQQHFIDSLNQQVTFLPKNGCPGPVVQQIGEHILLVLIDTQWLLHQWDKPGENSECEAKTQEQFFERLQSIFDQNKNKRIVIAAHHPLITYGEHGGVFTLRTHLFPITELIKELYIPMPIIGSLYPLYRKWIGHIQDTAHPDYRSFIRQIERIMATAPGTLYVSGHEHGLQHIQKGELHFLVSGTGSKIEFVRKKRYAKYARHLRGFIKLAVHHDQSMSVYFYHVDKEVPDGRLVYQVKL